MLKCSCLSDQECAEVNRGTSDFSCVGGARAGGIVASCGIRLELIARATPQRQIRIFAGTAIGARLDMFDFELEIKRSLPRQGCIIRTDAQHVVRQQGNCDSRPQLVNHGRRPASRAVELCIDRAASSVQPCLPVSISRTASRERISPLCKKVQRSRVPRGGGSVEEFVGAYVLDDDQRIGLVFIQLFCKGNRPPHRGVEPTDSWPRPAARNVASGEPGFSAVIVTFVIGSEL